MILADVDAVPVGIDRVGTFGSAGRCGSGNGIHRAGGRLLWLLEARLQDPWPARSPSCFFSDAALHRVGESLKGSVEDRGWDARSRLCGRSRAFICLLRGTGTAKHYMALVACNEGRPIDIAVASGGRVRWGKGQ